MDFLTYMQKKAAAPSLYGPGTPGYLTGKVGSFSNAPIPTAPTPLAPVGGDTGGGIGDTLNPFSDESDWGSRVLDVLSRGGYATSNMFQEGIRDVRAGDPSLQNGEELGLGNTIKAMFAGLDEPGQAWQGLSGQQKITGSDVVEAGLGDSADEKNGFGKGVASFAIDIFGDPTSYIGAGLIKGLVKGPKALLAGKSAEEVASATTDDMAKALTADAVTKKAPTELPPPNWLPPKNADQGLLFGDDQQALFDIGPGTGRASKLKTPELPETVKANDRQLDLFNPTKEAPSIPKRELDVAPKAIDDMAAAGTKAVDEVPTPRLTTEDVPWAKFTPPPKVLSQTRDYTDLPVPVGSPLNKIEAPWSAPGSTSSYMKPGPVAINNAEAVVPTAEAYAVKAAAAKSPTELADAYKAGTIRPPLDTPAERAFMDAVGVTDLRKSSDPLVPIDFFAVPKQFRDAMLMDDVSQATVFGGKSGNVAKQMPARKLWGILHGTETTTADLTKVYLRTPNGGKVSIAEVVKANDKALSDPKFWKVASSRAKAIADNPKQLTERIAKTNREHLRNSEKIVYDDFKDWAKEAQKLYPNVSTKTLKEAHDAAKDLLDEIWNKSVVNNPRASVERFMAAQRASMQIRTVMAEAIARKAPPEELVTDLAAVKHSFSMEQMDADLRKILASAAPDEIKLEAATTTQAAMKEADETLAAVEDAGAATQAARQADAQQAPSNAAVAIKSREAKNFSELTPATSEVLDGADWGTALSKDQAIGIVRGSVASILKTMMKPKNYSTYHQMNQTQVLNNIFSEIANAGKGEWKAVVRHRANAKSYKSAKVIELSRRVANIMRATERQMDGAAGFMPNVWNSGSKTAPGWKVGTPGKVQMIKDAPVDARNIPFSSAQLMDDMIAHDFALVAAGKEADSILPSALFGTKDIKQSALWTKVMEAAVFKNADAIKAMPTPALRKFVLDYDPMPNINAASNYYTGKITRYIKAQTDAAEKHVADAKVNDSAARASKVESETGAVAKETIQRTPAAPVEDAAAIGKTAEDSAKELAEALTPKAPVAAKIEQLKLPLGEVAKRKPNLPKANGAARSSQAAAGAEKAVPGQAIDDLDYNVPNTTRFKQIFQTHAGTEGLTATGEKVALRPLMQNYFDFVKASIASSARQWKGLESDLAKATNYDKNAMMQAIKSLDPKGGYTAVAGTEEVVRQMRKIMEDVMGGTDLSRHVLGNTSVTKGAIDREAINHWLKSHGGGKFQFDESDDWMSQWEKSIADAKTPEEAIHMLHTIEGAVKNATIERFMYDDLAVRFGSKSGGGYTVDLPYLSGVSFPTKEMALSVKRIGELVDQLQKPLSSNAILRTYDQMLRIWKTGMTIYNPVHHIKNFTGDMWLLLADGGRPQDLLSSFKMLNKYQGTGFNLKADPSQIKRYSDMNDLPKLMNELTGPTNVDRVSVVNKGTKHKFDDNQIMAAAKAHGMFQSAGQLEDIVESGIESWGRIGNKTAGGYGITAPFGGKLHAGASRTSEFRDHSVRLAHFIHGVRDSAVRKTAKMTDAEYQKLVFEDAARRARTHHPDGLDLTQAERKYARRMIPFYSWQRKSIPVILQTAYKRPGLITAYPKAQGAITYGMTGEDTEGYGSLPGDQMFPSWLAGSGFAAIGGSPITEGGEGYQLAKGPSEPASDLRSQMNDPMASLFSQLTPALSVPFELGNQEELGTGIPIVGKDESPVAANAAYLGKQVPGVSKLISSATNQNPNKDDLINWLTGLGLLDSGQYVDSAMYEEQMRQRNGGR